MPSPFPGMNPYLERVTAWSDFHTEFCKAIKKALVPLVQPEFYVKFNEHIYVHEESRRLVGLADVGVTRKPGRTENNAGVAVLEAPVAVRMAEVVVQERVEFLEIFDREYHTLVTVIELLSPTNKRKGPDREQFLAKRLQLLNSTVDYVEIRPVARRASAAHSRHAKVRLLCAGEPGFGTSGDGTVAALAARGVADHPDSASGAET